MKKVVLFGILVAVSLSVFAQWSANPLENLLISGASGEAVLPKVATHPSGYSYIGYFVNETGNYDVRLQKLDVYGNKLWGENGLLVSNNTSMSWLTDWDMEVDPDTCAILVFQDIRNGNNNVYAYRVSPSGEMLWGENGVSLSPNPDFNVTPDVEITAAGSYVFNWVRDAATQTVGMQKLNAAGDKLWGDMGLQYMGTEDYTWPLYCPTEGDDILMVFSKQTGPFWAPDRDLYVQRFNPDGASVWATDMLVANAGFIAGYTIQKITSDQNGGVFISWHDERGGTQVQETYVQHVGSNGGVFWEPNGVKVCLTPNQWHLDANIAYNALLDELYVFWTDRDFNQSLRGLSGQRISATGERLWGDNGKTIIPLHNGDYMGIFANTMGEDIAVFFLGQNPLGTLFAGVYGYKFDKEGNSLWPGDKVAISEVESEKLHMDVDITINGQVVLAWEDKRDDSGDIFGQNIQFDGSLGPVEPASLEVNPSTLVYETVEQCLDGQMFYVANYSDMALSIDNMEIGGWFAAMFPWWIEPAPAGFPIAINPGDSAGFNVMVDLPVTQMPLNYLTDTLSLFSGGMEYQVILSLNDDLISKVETNPITPFRIYPNPAATEISLLAAAGIQGLTRIEISGTDGAIVKTITADLTRTQKLLLNSDDGNRLSPGVYFIRFENNKVSFSSKFVVQ